jgi:phosphoribosyl 1,2-cyclic phosphodiesterase
MKITLWGTRGCIPSLEPDTARYGGNTSCVEVRGSNGSLLVLDAGTGIKRLGADLDPGISRVDILLTHLHLDHILGLGFFGPLDKPDMEVHIWGPPSLTMDLRSRLSRYLSPPIFPIHLRDLRSNLTIHDVSRGRFEIGGLEITSDLVCHPGPTFGYRITEGGSSIAYIPDHEPALGAHDFPNDPDWTSGFKLASDVDILIHDAQYTAAEYTSHVGWGHSSLQHALAFATAAHVDALVTFHHDPTHCDDLLDDLLLEAQKTSGLTFELAPGTEGANFQVGE